MYIQKTKYDLYAITVFIAFFTLNTNHISYNNVIIMNKKNLFRNISYFKMYISILNNV